MLHFGSSRRLSIDVDTITTALCISTNGYGHEEDFRFYSDGIARVRNFIHTERYNMIGAVREHYLPSEPSVATTPSTPAATSHQKKKRGIDWSFIWIIIILGILFLSQIF